MHTDEMLEIARMAATEVLNCKDNIIQEEFDTRYQDVKLLMKNYRKLRVYYDKVSPETLEVNVICSMHRKTGLMMSHVDKMLAAYKVLCETSEVPEEVRRWEVLYLRYMADERLNLRDIAERLNINKRTLYRDTERAMEDMAVLLFGIEAIGTWRHSSRISRKTPNLGAKNNLG